jgi:hypothetical protein
MLFITGVFMTLAIVNNVSAQNQVEIFVKARYINGNTYNAEIWANVPEGVPAWNIGASCIVVSYNANALDASDYINREVEIVNNELNGKGYSFTQTRAKNNSVSLNFISGNISGKIEDGSKSIETLSSSESFHLATLSWEIIDFDAEDGLRFDTDISEVSNRFTNLEYDCGNKECYTFLQPEPQKIGDLITSVRDSDEAMISINPNPCSGIAMIKYHITDMSNALIELTDMSGRAIALLADEQKQNGEYTIEYNTVHLAAGTYFLNYSIGDITGTKKLVVVK